MSTFILLLIPAFVVYYLTGLVVTTAFEIMMDIQHSETIPLAGVLCWPFFAIAVVCWAGVGCVAGICKALYAAWHAPLHEFNKTMCLTMREHFKRR